MNRLMTAAVGCILCACATDRTDDPVLPKTIVRTVSIEAAAPVTRTELAPNGVDVLWTPGDRIGVFVRSGDRFTTLNAPLTYEGAEAAAGGVFRGEITLGEGASDYALYAYYPYSEQAPADAAAVKFTLATHQIQAAAGDPSHLGDYDFLTAEVVHSATGEFGPLTFRHAFALVEVDLTASGEMAGRRLASVTLFGTDAASVATDGTLTDMTNLSGDFSFDLTAADNRTAIYTGGSAQIDRCGVTFATPPALGADTVRAYVAINPGDYARGEGRVYVAVRTTDGYTASFSRSGQPIAAGKMPLIRQHVSSGTAPQPAIDLSADGTANCYVATQPAQTYSFDATVAGNGVITQGLHEAVRRFEGRDLSAALSGGQARLLWQSAPYLIEPGSVAYAGGRISFTLSERPTQLGGNAVIGLYADAEATEALWSWHIWVTDRTNAELIAAAETYTMYAAYEAVYGAGSAQMMDRNLGAVYKEDGAYARSFRAPLYQWGRKDPFPWGKTVFDAQSRPRTFITAWRPVQTSGELGQYRGYTGNTWYATAHPETFIATTDFSSYDWYWGGGKGVTAAFRNNELWGNPDGPTVGQRTTKTLFDPCPPGWKVPHPYVFSAFTRTGATETVASGNAFVTGRFVQGWNFLYDGSRTTYYPGVGYRYDEFGLFAFMPSGYYWTSSPSDASSGGAWFFGMTAATIYERNTDPRGFGLPVRCQRE